MNLKKLEKANQVENSFGGLFHHEFKLFFPNVFHLFFFFQGCILGLDPVKECG